MKKFKNRRTLLNELALNIDEQKLKEILQTEEYKLYNAMITAEGAIRLALEKCDMGIALTDVVLIGYGRIGKVLAKMLVGMNAHLTIVVRDNLKLMNAKILGYNAVLEYDMRNANIIFNTAENYTFPETTATIIDLSTGAKQIIDASSLPETTATRKEVEYIKSNLTEK
ncbi:MAG: hypothetical protein FWE02_04745 [Defluviitaleaceae bacterium]|nr:hypothetical protein [Defluviitaleaceae bacterium]